MAMKPARCTIAGSPRGRAWHEVSVTAESLGASQITTFRRVTLPLILPGVVSGAAFAFAASFDEVIVVLLMAAPGQRTLPRQMFAGINENISLTIAAAATVLIAISLSLMILVSWLRRRSARMRQSGG